MGADTILQDVSFTSMVLVQAACTKHLYMLGLLATVWYKITSLE